MFADKTGSTSEKKTVVAVAKMICTVAGGPINIVRIKPKEPEPVPPELPPETTTTPPPLPAEKVEHPIVGHCIFCLRQLIKPKDNDSIDNVSPRKRKKGTSAENEELRIVEKSEVGKELISTFNKILPCLHKKWRVAKRLPDVSDVLGCKEKISSSGVTDSNASSAPLPKDFPILPDMCQFCGNKFVDLDRRITELHTKIHALATVIQESKQGGVYSWRFEQFEKHLRNDKKLNDKLKEATLNFLENFGECEFESTKKSTTDEVKVELKEEPESDEEFQDNGADDFGTMSPESAAPIREHDPVPDNPDPVLSSSKVKTSKLGRSNKRDAVKRPQIKKKITQTKASRQRKAKKVKVSKAKPEENQKCDLCKVPVALSKILDHIRGHVKDYACSCPNPLCTQGFSTPYKLKKLHLVKSSRSKCREMVKPLCQCRNKKSNRGICDCKWENICESCGYKTTSIRNFRIHLKYVHELPTEKNFSCPIEGCKEGFTVRQSVYSHLDTSHAQLAVTYSQKCPDCGEMVKIKEMAQHLLEIHNVADIISCKSCAFQFSSFEQLVEHLWIHRLTPESLTCYICNDGVQFLCYNLLEHHVYAFHKVGNMLSCENCEKTFMSKIRLINHQKRTHSPEKPFHAVLKPFACERCTRRFSRLSNFKNHQQICHRFFDVPRTKRYQCNVTGCGQTFMALFKLRRHKISCHSVGLSSKYTCEIAGCNKKYSVWETLKFHQVSVHGGQGQKEKGMFTSKESIKQICETCGESFSCIQTLRNHKLVHTGERPHQCSYCGQRFRHKEVMNRHIQSHEERGDNFKPNGPMKHLRKRVERKN